MKKIKNKILISAKHLRHRARPANVPRRFLHKDVPYFSQWASRELNQKIYEREFKTEDDPRWKESGASTKEEYVAWSWNSCGMACLKMLLAHRDSSAPTLVELGKKCAEYGGYTMPLEKSEGLIYAPFVKFVDKEFNLRGKVVSPMVAQDIIEQLGKSNYVIASVSPLIRQPSSIPKIKGGHLVLMLGYDLDKQELYLHNPSGSLPEAQEYAAISLKDFDKFFGNRGIVIET
ncbi:MAG: C39 family peptidase [Candidatus Saccharimonas sp.]